MESEGGWKAGLRSGMIPIALLGFALLLVLLTFSVPWFSVNTRIQAWEYDADEPDGKGRYTGQSVLVKTNMRPTTLETSIDPASIQAVLEQNRDLPSYENEMDGTGERMMGVLLLNIVAFFALAGATAFYVLHRRGRRDLHGGVWRFSGVFAVFTVFSLLYLAFSVPSAAQTDTREVLHGYAVLFESQGFPRLDPAMLNPNIYFYNTWVCCPPKSHFQHTDGNQYLVVVTTKSSPAAGFWLASVSLVLAGAGLALARSTGQLDEKQAPVRDASTAGGPRTA